MYNLNSLCLLSLNNINSTDQIIRNFQDDGDGDVFFFVNKQNKQSLNKLKEKPRESAKNLKLSKNNKYFS